jgi:2-keto-4-pentenoate hydratase/2-oxohepta-3-ene-1,7-dioic acid hydratase in catechol pathway
VSRESAADYIAGYSILNDVSARDLQFRDPQWLRGKCLDTFAPMGPYFVTADSVDDVAALTIETKVNGVVRQHERCGSMVFDIPRIIEFITEAITLEPGDIIATGTPAGTGNAFTPPRYLAIGDVVDITITGFGTLTSPVRAAQPAGDEESDPLPYQ